MSMQEEWVVKSPSDRAAETRARRARLGAPPAFNVYVPRKPKPILPPKTEPTPKPPRSLYRPDRRYERSWMIAICGTAELLDSNLSIRMIQDAVCEHYGISYTDLISARRTAALVLPRHVSMYLCKTHTPRSYPEISRRHGGRDHTVALYACTKIAQAQAADAALAEAIRSIREALHV